MKIIKLITISILLFFVNCASGTSSGSSASGLRSESSGSDSNSNASKYERIIIGKGKASQGAINSGSKVRSEAECKQAATMGASSEYTGGSGTVSGYTVISCKETSPNFASCECEVGFKKK